MSRYIDAEEVKHIMNEYIEKTGNDIFTRFHVTDFLNEADSKDIVKIVHAKWIKHRDDIWECSNCGAYIPKTVLVQKYCRWCGAKMEVEK